MMQQKWLRMGITLWLALLVAGEFQPLQAVAAAEFSCATVSEIPPTECAALVALYHNTAGVQWFEQRQWLVSNTPCTWSGVICSEGHVQELYLPANNLQGKIPEQVGNLTELAFLNLSDNRLQGQLPVSLGQLAHLEELYLTGNLGLTGNLPDSMATLPQLDLLWYSATGMCGASDFVQVYAGQMGEGEMVMAAQLSALDAWLRNLEDLQSAALKCDSNALPRVMFFPIVYK